MENINKVKSYRKIMSMKNLHVNILLYIIFNVSVLANYLASELTSSIHCAYIIVTLTWGAMITFKSTPMTRVKKMVSMMVVNRRVLEAEIFSKKLKDLELKKRIQHYKLRKSKKRGSTSK